MGAPRERSLRSSQPRKGISLIRQAIWRLLDTRQYFSETPQGRRGCRTHGLRLQPDEIETLRGPGDRSGVVGCQSGFRLGFQSGKISARRIQNADPLPGSRESSHPGAAPGCARQGALLRCISISRRRIGDGTAGMVCYWRGDPGDDCTGFRFELDRPVQAGQSSLE